MQLPIECSAVKCSWIRRIRTRARSLVLCGGRKKSVGGRLAKKRNDNRAGDLYSTCLWSLMGQVLIASFYRREFYAYCFVYKLHKLPSLENLIKVKNFQRWKTDFFAEQKTRNEKKKSKPKRNNENKSPQSLWVHLAGHYERLMELYQRSNIVQITWLMLFLNANCLLVLHPFHLCRWMCGCPGGALFCMCVCAFVFAQF